MEERDGKWRKGMVSGGKGWQLKERAGKQRKWMVNGGRGEPEERDGMWRKGVVALPNKSGRGSQPPQQPQEQKI